MSMKRGKTTSFSFRKWTLVRFDTIAFRAVEATILDGRKLPN